jgi:hypothetical protein
MAYALISEAIAGGTGNVATTGAIDTTGANLIVIIVADYNAEAPSVVTDSKSNNYTALSTSTGQFSQVLIHYLYNPTVGSGHTFTATRTGGFPAIKAYAFSGSVASPFDVGGGDGVASPGPTTVQPGPVTPSEDNELLVTGWGWSQVSDTPTIDGGFSSPTSVNNNPGVHFALSAAYLIQTTATLSDPTWTISSSAEGATRIATFKAGAGGEPPPVTLPWQPRHTNLWGPKGAHMLPGGMTPPSKVN